MDALFKKIIEETDFQKLFVSKGYAFFTNKSYNLNLIGIRNFLLPITGLTSNEFNDAIVVIARESDNGPLMKWIFDATTDAGLYYRKSPMNSAGTAILVPGQYRGCWKLGTHSGYPALQQNKPVTVWRDNNKDDILDTGNNIKKETGMFGINIHRASASGTSTQVDKWSAGCQTIASSAQWNQFMNLINKSAKIWGSTFTYTLLELKPQWT